MCNKVMRDSLSTSEPVTYGNHRVVQNQQLDLTCSAVQNYAPLSANVQSVGPAQIISSNRYLGRPTFMSSSTSDAHMSMTVSASSRSSVAVETGNVARTLDVQ